MKDASTIAKDIYSATGRSLPQRLVMTGFGAISVALAWWILCADGIQRLSPWQPGNEFRRLCLAVALTVYFLRLLATNLFS
jgi:hypothetical protein